MKYPFPTAVSLVLVCIAAASWLESSAHAQVEDDARLWAGFTGKVDIIQPLEATVTQEVRLDDNFVGHEKTFTQIGLRYRINKYLQLGGHYRFSIADDEAAMVTDIRNRVAAELRLRWPINDLRLDYRLRLQTTGTNDGMKSYVRNKVGIEYALNKNLAPFAAFELHYSTTASEFRQVRFYGGLNYELSKRFDIEGFYLYRYEFNVQMPERNHIIGIGASYQFRRVRKGK